MRNVVEQRNTEALLVNNSKNFIENHHLQGIILICYCFDRQER